MVDITINKLKVKHNLSSCYSTNSIFQAQNTRQTCQVLSAYPTVFPQKRYFDNKSTLILHHRWVPIRESVRYQINIKI